VAPQRLGLPFPQLVSTDLSPPTSWWLSSKRPRNVSRELKNFIATMAREFLCTPIRTSIVGQFRFLPAILISLVGRP